MIESVVYVISIIIEFLLVVLIKKSDKKLEIFKSIVLILVLFIAYNGLVCYMLNLINIPITLINLSIINFILCILMLALIIKNKKIQQYKISKTNIIVTVIFIIIIGIVTNINFNNITKIRYVSMDSREHYKAAREFSENEFLSNKATKNNTVTPNFMPIAYINEGILFKIFNPFIGTVNLYKIYILFEAYAILLTILMFYMIVEKYLKSIKGKIIAIIFSIIYMLGYPLNAWISGFHYLILGILFTETIIYINSNKEMLNLESNLLMAFLVNFGLILSYSLFCPFVYGAEFIYSLKKDKNKAILFLYILVALIIPGIIGVSYLILPSLGKVSTLIEMEGWLYKNLWSNFILFIPFAIYTIYKCIKNKEFSFDNLMLILLVIYMIILFVGTKTEKCSEYYFYKNYYILWMLLILLSIKGMLKIIESNNARYIVYIYTILYLVMFSISLYTVKTYAKQDANDSLSKTMEIFTFNNTMINAKNAEFVTKEELELYKVMEEIIEDNWKDYDNEILFITNLTQESWIQSLTGYKIILYNNKEYAIQNLKQNNYKYIIISKNRTTYQDMKKYMDTNNLELIYDTNNGEIYQKIENAVQ